MADAPHFHWFLPMQRDNRAYGSDPDPRPATRRYIVDVARAAETNGFESLLLATAHDTHDTWLIGTAAAAETTTIRFIVAFRAGYTLPTLTAQMIDTFQQLYDDRLDAGRTTSAAPTTRSPEAAGPGRSAAARIQVISRNRSEDAWAETDRILARLTPSQVAKRQRELAERASVGQRRVQSLNPGVIDPARLRPYPTIWSGLGLVGGGGGSTALVGSHAEVAERIHEYTEAGITHFIVSGAPLLEEAYRFGEGVIPHFH
jgi:alkanesulfonate monooxygenase SsuD/methylene tetrahydromethanopterin reductase-like flavin-dependent oxidoreductase (luciferase family)